MVCTPTIPPGFPGPRLIEAPARGEKGDLSESQIISRFPGFIIARASVVQVGEPEVEPAYSPAIWKSGIQEERQDRGS